MNQMGHKYQINYANKIVYLLMNQLGHNYQINYANKIA